MLVAGGIRGNRYLQHPAGTPMTNLYLTLLDRMGVKLDRFGDAQGRLAGF